jgi:phosphoglycolate phosphatase-like HAD superfamily hydrolase
MPTLFLDLAGTLVDLTSFDSVSQRITCFLTEETAALLTPYTLILVTGSPRAQVEKVLLSPDIPLSLHFQAIVAAEDGGNQKSSGAPFLQLIKEYDGPFVHVGDSDVDEEGARMADIPFVRVAQKNTNEEQRQELTRAISEALNIS